MKLNARVLVPLAAVGLAVLVIAAAAVLLWPERPTSALATFEVNPQFTLAVDSRSEVVEVIPHDASATALFGDWGLERTPLEDAVRKIIAELSAAGYIVSGSNLSVAVRPAPDGSKEDAAAVADGLRGRLANLPGEVAVVVVTLSAEDFKYLAGIGLSPRDYADIVADAGTMDAIRRIAELNGASGQEGELPADTLGAIVDAVNEMRAVGIGHAEALSLIETAAAKQLDLKRVSEFADVYEELTGIGLTGGDSLALIMSAITARVSMDGIWEMAELEERKLSPSDDERPASKPVRTPTGDDPGSVPGGAPGSAPGGSCDCDKPATPVEPPPSTPEPTPLSAQDAEAIALATVPNSSIVAIDRSTERGRAIWEVVVRNPDGTGTEIYIDARTGEVMKRELTEPTP